MVARKTKRMEEVTDDQWNLVNKQNKSLVEEFIDYCVTVDRSPQTIIGYTSDLRILMNWLREYCDNKEFFDINKRDVSKFQNWCIKQGLSPSRIRRLKSSASSCANYIENMMDEDYPHFRNIINKIPAPNLSFVREKTILSEDQINDLMNSLVESGNIQHACFVAVLAASGMRKSEIVQCDMNWFFGEPNIVEGMYISPQIRTKGKGVGGKKLNKYVICAIADKYLKMWEEERKRLGIEHESLFVTKRNGIWERIQITTVDSWMRTFTIMTNIDIYCHSFRHYSGTWLKRNGVELSQIRDFFGHEDSSTTEIYIDIGKEENLKGMLKFLEQDDDE